MGAGRHRYRAPDTTRGDDRLGWTAADVPDLSGRVAVVTGANAGVGWESSVVLAAAGAHVVMATRDPDRAEAARARLRGRHPGASVEVVALDLASLESVRRAAATITSRHGRVDVLVNNAGVMAVPEGRTVDGFETHLGVNHLGHWVLTSRLTAALLAADRARIVTVTSTARLGASPVPPHNPDLVGQYDPWDAYGRSKLANMHFALGLHRRLAGAGASAESLAAHPGLSRTNLLPSTAAAGGGGHLVAIAKVGFRVFGTSARRGALAQLRAATDPEARGGELYGPRFGAFGSPVRRRIRRSGGLDEQIETLWALSEELTGEAPDVGAGR
jgi:NAD(P)-dependent dehydrogenase (short-subunit alcohol dehydrogenase family)